MAWCRDTCYPPLRDNYEFSDPATGQCAVTALLIQDILGGEIVLCNRLNHYYNRINGEDLDLTRSQFPEDEIVIWDEIVDRRELLKNHDTIERYYLLRRNYKFNLDNYNIILR